MDLFKIVHRLIFCFHQVSAMGEEIYLFFKLSINAVKWIHSDFSRYMMQLNGTDYCCLIVLRELSSLRLMKEEMQS